MLRQNVSRQQPVLISTCFMEKPVVSYCFYDVTLDGSIPHTYRDIIEQHLSHSP
jgi:hypothetical protein